MDSYSAICAIGKGTYATAWLVSHRPSGRQYVRKEIALGGLSDKARELAIQEAKLLSRLSHPNIVSLKEWFMSPDGGSLMLVLQHCEGGDLHQALEERRSQGRLLRESQIMDWFVQIALAIQYLHQNHILHRDIKTKNIFLTGGRIIKVGDFGAAKQLETSQALAHTYVGTPYNMAPEVLDEKPYSSKSDIWSFGCVLYEMATLRLPFKANSLLELHARVSSGTIAPISQSYSPQLSALVMSMLSVSQHHRPSIRKIIASPYVQTHIRRFMNEVPSRSSSSAKSQSAKAEETRISTRQHVKTARSSSQDASYESSTTSTSSTSTKWTGMISSTQSSSAAQFDEHARIDIVKARPSDSASSDRGVAQVSASHLVKVRRRKTQAAAIRRAGPGNSPISRVDTTTPQRVERADPSKDHADPHFDKSGSANYNRRARERRRQTRTSAHHVESVVRGSLELTSPSTASASEQQIDLSQFELDFDTSDSEDDIELNDSIDDAKFKPADSILIHKRRVDTALQRLDAPEREEKQHADHGGQEPTELDSCLGLLSLQLTLDGEEWLDDDKEP